MKQVNRPKHPNILLIMVDEMRMPREPYDASTGVIPELRPILGFDPKLDKENRFCSFFPGLMALREHSIAFRNHSAASCACNPSRAAIFTGQYSSRTGVAQTDGAFKDRNDPDFPWLSPNGTPTMGDWFRAAGYDTHYFGKWHVSNPATGSLEPYGFSDWQLSIPEAQGYGYGNLGAYRDVSFADLVTTFLDRRALGSNYEVWRSSANYISVPAAPNSLITSDPKPWLAVASLVNPHDITGWPLPWAQTQFSPNELLQNVSLDKPLPVPRQGDRSQPPPGGTYRLPLNPDGFPGEGFTFPSTSELLAELEHVRRTKPRAHYESAYKVGLTFRSLWPAGLRDQCPLPMQIIEDPALQHKWWLAYGNFYTWFQYLVDIQIDRIMRCINENGLRDNTIVVFCADHGEYAGAHGGMLQKWYTAYNEAIHVPLVVSAPWIGEGLRATEEVTSHIDIVPTLLGLAGYGPEKRAQLADTIHGKKVEPLPGADLAPLIYGERDQVIEVNASGPLPREGVLFTTSDQVTAPVFSNAGPTATPAQEALNSVADIERGGAPYLLYLGSVEKLRKNLPLRPGPVAQPNTVQCIRTQKWKLSRYWDSTGSEPDQWELYARCDSREAHNLVEVEAIDGHPVACVTRIAEFGQVTVDEVREALPWLEALLHRKLEEAGFEANGV